MSFILSFISVSIYKSNYLLCTCFIFLNCWHLATKKTWFHPATLQKTKDQGIPKNNTAGFHRPHLASAESSNLSGAIDLSRGCLMFHSPHPKRVIFFKQKWCKYVWALKWVIFPTFFGWYFWKMIHGIEKAQQFDDVFRTKWLKTSLETKIMPSIILGVSYIWFLLGMVNLIMSCLSIQTPGTNGKSFPGCHQFSGFFPVGDWNPSAEEILLSQSYSR